MVSRMKIMFVLPGSGHAPVGGFKVVYEYANRLAERGHDVVLVHPALLRRDTRWYVYPKKWMRFAQRRLNRSYRPDTWYALSDLVDVRWVFSPAQTKVPKSDVVIATAWQTAEWVMRYPRNRGRKFYLVQDYEHFMAGDERQRRRMRATYAAGMCNLAISPAVADMVAASGGKVHAYLPNGIDFRVFTLSRAIDDVKRCWVGFPARPEPFKGTEDAVSVLTRVRQRLGPTLQVWAFGGRKPKCIPDWVTYYRRPSNALLGELYNQTAVFVTASHYEGWGLPGAEAMACGAALVSTDHGGVRAYGRDGRTAALSPAGDVGAMTKNLVRVLEDDSLRQRLGLAGCRQIRTFDWASATDRMERALSGDHVRG